MRRRDRYRSEKHWGVDVRHDGELILTIESNCLSGKSELSESDIECIRRCAHHLLAFAGNPHRAQLNRFLDETK